jgi:hypothetical protein
MIKGIRNTSNHGGGGSRNFYHSDEEQNDNIRPSAIDETSIETTRWQAIDPLNIPIIDIPS